MTGLCKFLCSTKGPSPGPVMLIVMLIVITMVIFGYSTIIKKECLSFSSIKLFERLDRKFIT